MRVGAIAIAAAIVTAVPAGGARADHTVALERIPLKARELAERGRAYHDAGDYAAAVEAFRDAYVLAPSPGLLFNLAQSLRLGGNCDDAAWMYRRYLETDPSSEQRALAENHLRSVDRCGQGGLHIMLPPPSPTAASEPRDDDVAPLVATAGPADPPGRRAKRIGIGLAIGGGIALAGAAYFALDASDAASSVGGLREKGGKPADAASTDARGQRSATIATVLGLGGAAALVAGGAFYLLGRHYEHAQRIAVTPTGQGAQVSMRWSF